MTLQAIDPQPLEMLPTQVEELAFDFSVQLAPAGPLNVPPAETLTGPPSLAVTIKGVAPGTEISWTSPVINGALVQFWVTTTNAPIGNRYKFACTCATSIAPRVVAGRRILEIIDEG